MNLANLNTSPYLLNRSSEAGEYDIVPNVNEGEAIEYNDREVECIYALVMVEDDERAVFTTSDEILIYFVDGDMSKVKVGDEFKLRLVKITRSTMLYL